MFAFLRGFASIPKMKSVFSSENLIYFYQITRRHNFRTQYSYYDYNFHTTSLIFMGFLLHNDKFLRNDSWRIKPNLAWY